MSWKPIAFSGFTGAPQVVVYRRSVELMWWNARRQMWIFCGRDDGPTDQENVTHYALLDPLPDSVPAAPADAASAD